MTSKPNLDCSVAGNGQNMLRVLKNGSKEFVGEQKISSMNQLERKGCDVVSVRWNRPKKF